MYLPQPIASCLRSPPEDTKPPFLAPVTFPAAAPCPLHYIHARWKFTYPFTPPSSFLEWYMARLRYGPRLMAVCAHLRISPQLLEHTQIPELRAIVQVRLPIAGAPEEVALPSQPTTVDALLHAGWRPDLVLQMPRERDQPALAELPVSLRQPQAIRPPSVSPLLADEDPSGSLKHYFLAGFCVASQAHLQDLVSPERFAFCSAPLPNLRTMVRMPRPTSYQELQTCLRRTWWLNRRLSLSPNLALGLQARRLLLLPLPNARACEGWPCSVSRVRLPAGGRTLAGGSTLPGRDCALA